MHLFSEPTYRERLSDFTETLGERVSDGFGRMTQPVRDATDTEFARAGVGEHRDRADGARSRRGR